MDRDWMPTTQSIERVSGQSQEREFSMQRQGDKIGQFDAASRLEPASRINQARMSLTPRPYRECLFHTTTTESGWWARPAPS